MKTHSFKPISVVPRGMVPMVNGEAATVGTASLALNVREREQSLQVVGAPVAAGDIGVGERLLLISSGHHVTSIGSAVKIDGHQVAVIDGTILGAHAIGTVIVIVTDGGLTYLGRQGGRWVVLNPSDAVPQLTFGADTVTATASIEAYAFASPYSQWRAPLAPVDTTALAQSLLTAWNAMNSDSLAEGRYTAPMLVRWAVRLIDGTYLWMSDPVRVGDETLVNVQRILAGVTTGSGGFTGIEASAMPFVSYGLDITVAGGIADEWLPLVAGIDVLATSQAQLLTSSRTLDYRCVSRGTGTHEYLLEMGLSRRSAAAIASQLASSPWRVIATAPASAQLSGDDFTAPLETVTMTRGQCQSVGAMQRLDSSRRTALLQHRQW